MNPNHLQEVLIVLNETRSRQATQEFIETNGYSFNIEEAIAIAQAVCAVGCGEPSPDSLCAIINTL